MSEKSHEFLMKLLNTNSPSGYEVQAAKVYCDYVGQFCDVETDVMCNSVAVINPEAEFKILIDAHYDEIGMQVMHIDHDGYIYFRKIGGLDPAVLHGTEVVILTEKGEIYGIIGKKPIHLQKPDDFRRVPDFDEMWIDIGAVSGAEAKERVSIGDPVTIRPNAKFISPDRLVSKGLDDKIGVFVIAEVMRILSSENINIGVYGMASAQEEIGCRGSRIQAQKIKPNMAICVDIGFASDVPNISERNVSRMILGAGVSLCHSADNNPRLVKLIKETAKEKNIPYQDNVPTTATGGTNTSQIQLADKGVATALLRIPSRYAHSPVEICDIKDVNQTINLLIELIKKIDREKIEDFIPLSSFKHHD